MVKGLDFIGVTITFICHDGQGNFVMAKRSQNARDEQGTWDNGGGGVEFGETIEDCLRKEIKEEYCADVLEYEFLGYRDVHRVQNDRPSHWIALDFLVRVDRDQVRNGEPHKFDDIGWFTIDTLPSPLHSQVGAHLKNHEAKLQL